MKILKSRNILLLNSVLIKYIFLFLIVFNIFSILIGRMDFVWSSILGAVFSYFVAVNMQRVSESVLSGRSLKPVFVNFLIRIILYAAPVILALKLESSFNMTVLLIFLFVFQAGFIAISLLRGIKKNKKRA
ncbi:hypothetical protein ACFLZV_00160 [Candidatus Margulisiibacteriota bacterium]